jgi:DEAD/DEAH box helicase domain-containing protein
MVISVMRQVFLDVETQKTFDEVGGYLPQKLGVSFVGTFIRDGYAGGEYQGFFEQDLPKLWPMLETADVIVGFNIESFDRETLRPYYAGAIDQWGILDLLVRFKDATGHRISLDSIAQETLGKGKSGDGLDAIRYYRSGQLRELAKYCLRDVEITRDIYDYGRVNNKVKYVNKWNRKIEAPVDFSFTPPRLGGVQMALL